METLPDIHDHPEQSFPSFISCVGRFQKVKGNFSEAHIAEIGRVNRCFQRGEFVKLLFPKSR